MGRHMDLGHHMDLGRHMDLARHMDLERHKVNRMVMGMGYRMGCRGCMVVVQLALPVPSFLLQRKLLFLNKLLNRQGTGAH